MFCCCVLMLLCLCPVGCLSWTQQKINIRPILFLYYEERMVSSNLNSKLFRFHCVRPSVHMKNGSTTQIELFFLCVFTILANVNFCPKLKVALISCGLGVSIPDSIRGGFFRLWDISKENFVSSKIVAQYSSSLAIFQISLPWAPMRNEWWKLTTKVFKVVTNHVIRLNYLLK